MQALPPASDQANSQPREQPHAKTTAKQADTYHTAAGGARASASAEASRATAQAAQASGPTTPDRDARIVSHPVIVTPSTAAVDGSEAHAHASPADDGAAAPTGALLAIDDEYETMMSMLAD